MRVFRQVSVTTRCWYCNKWEGLTPPVQCHNFHTCCSNSRSLTCANGLLPPLFHHLLITCSSFVLEVEVEASESNLESRSFLSICVPFINNNKMLKKLFLVELIWRKNFSNSDHVVFWLFRHSIQLTNPIEVQNEIAYALCEWWVNDNQCPIPPQEHCGFSH